MAASLVLRAAIGWPNPAYGPQNRGGAGCAKRTPTSRGRMTIAPTPANPVRLATQAIPQNCRPGSRSSTTKTVGGTKRDSDSPSASPILAPMKKPREVIEPRWGVYLLKRKAERLPFTVAGRNAEQAVEEYKIAERERWRISVRREALVCDLKRNSSWLAL